MALSANVWLVLYVFFKLPFAERRGCAIFNGTTSGGPRAAVSGLANGIGDLHVVRFFFLFAGSCRNWARFFFIWRLKSLW